MTKFSLAFLFSILLFSCGDTTNNKLIVGNWSAAEWLISGHASNYDVMHTSFSFDSTGHYTYNYAGSIENGTYKVENDNLFTTPDKQAEMMVKIMKLTADSLVFNMNRSGQDEQLTLIKTNVVH